MSVERFALVAVAVGLCALAAPAVAPQLLGAALAPPPEAGRSSGSATAAVASSPPAAPSVGREVILAASERGQFETSATIDGRTIPVMVDTGATAVAISSDTARRLGILPPLASFRIPVTTANGSVDAAAVMLDEVTVGRITVRNVDAIVVPGNVLGQSLLGMSFLSRLGSFAMADGKLTLRR